MSVNLRAALGYVEKLGWPVFPVHHIERDGRCSCGNAACEGPGKHPRIKAWQEEATTNPARVRAWWSTWPAAHIGLHATSFWALDVDPRSGGDDSLRALEATHGPLPTTPRQLTGGGGEHHLFAPAPGVRNRARFLPGLDTRAPGGFIVAAPSGHVSGRSYAWDVDAHPLEVPIVPAPTWLIDLVTAGTAPGRATSPDAWVGLLRAGVDEGERDATLARLAGHLLRRYVDPDVTLELLHVWNATRCRPPLDGAQVEKVVVSVMRKEARRREQAA